VDELYTRIYAQLIPPNARGSPFIERASHLILVIKELGTHRRPGHQHLEEVLFILEGRNVKHCYSRTATAAHHLLLEDDPDIRAGVVQHLRAKDSRSPPWRQARRP